jgi:dTDP-4-dehydrorhamnose reductase
LRILTLGSSGFVGSFLSKHPFISSTDQISQPSRLELTELGDGSFSLGVERVITTLRPDIVLNLVAQTDIKYCSEHALESSLVNVSLPIRIAEVLPPTSLLIQVSSDAVFGAADPPYAVNSAPCPTNEYGNQKMRAEKGVAEIRSNFLILRGSFFGLSSGGRLGTLEFFTRALSADRQVPGYLDYINNPISLFDLRDALQKCVENRNQGILHLGSLGSISKYDFGVLVAKNLGTPTSLVQPTLSPIGFNSHGGLNLTLDSGGSWATLGLDQPRVEAGVIKSLDEFK